MHYVRFIWSPYGPFPKILRAGFVWERQHFSNIRKQHLISYVIYNTSAGWQMAFHDQDTLMFLQ